MGGTRRAPHTPLAPRPGAPGSLRDCRYSHRVRAVAETAVISAVAVLAALVLFGAFIALRGLDPVAYVRFASVYRNFREARDFEVLLGELAGESADEEPVPDKAAT